MEVKNPLDLTTDLDRYSPETNTCATKQYDNFLQGFFSQFQDAFFFSNVMQFILVILMYLNVGNGKYWKVLFYASIAGLLGSVIENANIAYLCQKSNTGKSLAIPFFVEEIFWIFCEYSIPLLNLIKMKAFSQGRVAKLIKYLIYLLFIPFAGFRLLIGYHRMNKGYISDNAIKRFHGNAFGIMAIADILCTIFILYFVKKHNQESCNANTIQNYIKHSSYTILVAVDIVSLVLSILYITFSSGLIFKTKSELLVSFESITVPFHCIKSDFILILAVDALLFKYGANTNSSLQGSSEASKTNLNNDSSNYKSRLSTYKMNPTKVANISQFTYNGSNDRPQNKFIVKNYTTNAISSPTNILYSNGVNNNSTTIEIKAYPPEEFESLYQSNNEYSDLIPRK